MEKMPGGYFFCNELGEYFCKRHPDYEHEERLIAVYHENQSHGGHKQGEIISHPADDIHGFTERV